MQVNINFLLKTLVVVFVFGAVFYFFFGQKGKYNQANEKLSEIQNTKMQNSLDVEAEIKMQE